MNNEKILVILFVLLCNTNIFAQTESLYDVNYDAPKNMLHYNDEVSIFQQIYLQYGRTLTTNTEYVQVHEYEKFQTELQNIKNEHQLEIQNLLLAEEKKREDAIKKTRDDIYAFEIAQLKMQEKSKLETEIMAVLNAKLVQEYEEKKNNELAILEAELRNTISLENKELEEKYKLDVRNSLASEYEAKKNDEIESLKSSLKKEAFKETEATMQIISTILPYVICGISLIIIALIVLKIVKIVIKKAEQNKAEKTQKENIEKEIETLMGSYIDRLKRYNGNKSPIEDELNAENDPNKKSIMQEALKRADKNYQSIKDMKSIQEYKERLDELDPSGEFDIWNGAAKNDTELKTGICNNFLKNIKDYTNIGAELYFSRKKRLDNEKQEIDDLLTQFAGVFENISKQVESLASTENNEFRNRLISIKKGYEELAKKFRQKKF